MDRSCLSLRIFNLQANSTIMTLKAKSRLSFLIEIHMKEKSKTGKCMAEGGILTLMVSSIRGNFIMDSSGGIAKLLIFPTQKSKPMKDK